MKERFTFGYADFEKNIDNLFLQKDWVTNFLQVLTFDKELYGHLTRVAYIAYQLATFENIEGKNKEDLIAASLLHDIGKFYIPKELLNSKTGLTDDEKKVMNEHVRLGFNIIKFFDPVVANIMVAHHEFQDNSYPRNGRKPENENLYKMQFILALSDHTDSLLSPRSYKPAWTEEAVRSELGKIFLDNKLIEKAIEVRKTIDQP